ncbi:hypothetical protein [Crenobacter cavernae]|uniref:Uncharacterized protein n=1 Tax=Crenobacter cavernae TaxID=2290923 RepID=A0A345Y4K8_9NEIS|nr:hypothetical protein [Crenobacter cavernae]AXK38860.1 hypothetical protein DWG20_05110 [Crenobacter cavernae]
MAWFARNSFLIALTDAVAQASSASPPRWPEPKQAHERALVDALRQDRETLATQLAVARGRA